MAVFVVEEPFNVAELDELVVVELAAATIPIVETAPLVKFT